MIVYEIIIGEAILYLEFHDNRVYMVSVVKKKKKKNTGNRSVCFAVKRVICSRILLFPRSSITFSAANLSVNNE